VRDSSTITKTAYVYLPYGYDDSVSYNILYLMHGWGGHAGEYFEYGNVVDIIDNMIGQGIIEPLIVVSPSFYNSNSSTDFSSSVAEFRQFYQDFRYGLMPAIESRYSTYASSVSDDDLRSSRDHRAFGGFSLGAVTTWLQFCENSDYIRYFLPMSGSSWYHGTYGDLQFERNVDHIEEVVKQHGLEERGYLIYHAVGTADPVKYQSVEMAAEMLSRNMFTSEHYLFYQKQQGQHDFYSVREFIYNALPLFFNDGIGLHFTKDSKITDVIEDDAFEGFGRLIFPVNTSYYSGERLSDLRLTWYSNIDADKTVEIVNHLKNRFLSGEKVFYDIYTEEEKSMDSSKRDTGLFFFKGNKDAKVAIVNAGGGMAYVGAMHDSFPHALELSKKGYTHSH
jgi:endo-1,4-beta-xylanase